MPDDALREEATQGKLRTNLESQVRRMLADPKSRALVDNFAGQWLETRKLATVTPDPERFKPFDDQMRADMRTETEMFFEHVVREDRSRSSTFWMGVIRSSTRGWRSITASTASKATSFAASS